MGEQMSLDAEEDLYARIRRSNAETEKFIGGQRKLMAESEKLAAECRRFDRGPFAGH